jgi:hypothetical protein
MQIDGEVVVEVAVEVMGEAAGKAILLPTSKGKVSIVPHHQHSDIC